MKKLYDAARYIAGFFILFYGFAKLNGSQFTILDSELDKPMGEVSGFWLTWYYFGYSAAYGNIIAFMQVLAGIGLLFRKTTLVAALMLLGIMGNILMVDFFYDVPIDGSAVAIIITALVVIILIPHIKELIEVLWTRQNSVYGNTRASAGLWVLRLLIVIIPACFTYYTANYNNRRPTVVDGKWEISRSAVTGTGYDSLQNIYFERNRAFMMVFKYPRHWETHHFEIDKDAGIITIWDKYMSKGRQLLKANYRLNGDVLELKDSANRIELNMRKVQQPR